ncbi:MAG: glycosyltransferase family 2 protein [Planctomycetes bacterium]|nr:glycosyltransferase family 2 protein [Planctomycetota bacterium]
MTTAVELSVVIPVYNSAAIFPELYRRLNAALAGAVSSFEIVAVCDGCRDASYDVIARTAATDPRVRGIDLSRNFGHQAAVTAGLDAAAGTWVGVIDDDLEDPPEVLAQMLAQARTGFDVVYGIRRSRRRALPYRILYRVFYRVLGLMVDIRIPHDAGDFCVMSGQVVRVLRSLPESNRYLRGLRAWSGFRQTGLEYDREARAAGESGYTLRHYVRLALDAIFSFSYLPLKLASIAGITIALVSFAIGAWVVWAKLQGEIRDVPGWASVFVAVLFFSGIQLLGIGIIGEYVARIYDEVKRRPTYVVARRTGEFGAARDGGSVG